MGFNKRYITSKTIAGFYKYGGADNVYHFIKKSDAIIILNDIDFCRKVIELVYNSDIEHLDDFLNKSVVDNI